MDDPGVLNLTPEDLERITGQAEAAEAAGNTEEAARLREQAEAAQERAEAAEERAERAEAQEAREEARAEKLDRQAEQAERLGNEERAERLERMADQAETRAERAEVRADAAQEQAATARAEADAATAQAETAEAPQVDPIVEETPFDPAVTTTAEDLGLGDDPGFDPAVTTTAEDLFGTGVVGPAIPNLEDLTDRGIAGDIEEIRDALDDALPFGGGDSDGGSGFFPNDAIIEEVGGGFAGGVSSTGIDAGAAAEIAEQVLDATGFGGGDGDGGSVGGFGDIGGIATTIADDLDDFGPIAESGSVAEGAAGVSEVGDDVVSGSLSDVASDLSDDVGTQADDAQDAVEAVNEVTEAASDIVDDVF